MNDAQKNSSNVMDIVFKFFISFRKLSMPIPDFEPSGIHSMRMACP